MTNNTIFVKTEVTDQNKFQALDTLLQESHFWKQLASTCKAKQKTNSTCNIIIKPNISIASQKSLLSYTDPELVNHLVSRLHEKKYKTVAIVESENMYSIGFPEHTPDRVGKNLGYKYPITNLTADSEQKQCFTSPDTNICLSHKNLNTDFLVNFPKGRNHCIFNVTGALKNLFGLIPNRDKMGEFHNKRSGLNVPEAIKFVYDKHPPDFTIMDWTKSIDGEDEHFAKEPLTEYKTVGRLIAGQNAIAVDMYLHQKMGYDVFDSPIMNQFNTTITLQVKGDQLTPLTDWKPVPMLTKIQFKTLLSVTDNIRKIPTMEDRVKNQFRKMVMMDVI